MIHPWHGLPPGSHPPAKVTAVTEIPRGRRNKYELDTASGLFRLARGLSSAVPYPASYGFIPPPLAEANAPAAPLLPPHHPPAPRPQLTSRPIGVLRMTDRGEPDDKILAVPSNDPFYEEYFDIADIPQHYLREVEHFFHIYKDLEGKRVQTIGWEQAPYAMQVIREAMERYDEKFVVRSGP